MGRKPKRPRHVQRQIVLQLLRGKESCAALARKYNVSDETLYRWQRAFLADHKGPLPAEGGPSEASQVAGSSPKNPAFVLDAVLQQCPECGSLMTADYRSPRTVVVPFRKEVDHPWKLHSWRLSSRIRRCHNTACIRYLAPYRPEAEGRIALPGYKLSLPLLYHIYRMRTEKVAIRKTQAILSSQGIDLAHSTIEDALAQLKRNPITHTNFSAREDRWVIREFLNSYTVQQPLLLDIFSWRRSGGRGQVWLIRDCYAGHLLFTGASQTNIVLDEVLSKSRMPIRGVLSPLDSAIPSVIRKCVPGVKQRPLPTPQCLLALPEAIRKTLGLPFCYSEVLGAS